MDVEDKPGNTSKKRKYEVEPFAQDKLEPSPPRSSNRLRSVAEKKREGIRSKFPDDMAHFGSDVTPFVREAMDSGGKLDQSGRDEIATKMRSTTVTGKSLGDVLPKAFVPQVKDVFGSKSFTQSDAREKPQSGERYGGFMFTSSFVNPSSEASEKEIPRPSSPRPGEYGKSEAHQSHTAPFALVGPESNRAKTVWNSQWANIGVDSKIEKAALNQHKQGAEVVHFRFDTDTRSSVGFVAKTPKGEFSTTSLQYQRRQDGDKK